MRVSRIRWVSHTKTTILSVDVQPSGYRFITGGADAYVRIWNLMPVISYEREMEGEDSEENEENSMVLGEPGAENDPLDLDKKRQSVSSAGARQNNEDSKMRESDNESESDDGLTPEERLKQE